MSLPDTARVSQDIKTAVEALLASRAAFGGRFSDSDSEWGAAGDSGPTASMQGLRGAFGAVAALITDRELWAIVKPHFPSLMDEWSSSLDELAKTHYGADPYDIDGSLERIRTEIDKDGAPYTDTLSWALSTSILLNYIFPFCEEHGLRVSAELRDRTRDEIARSLRHIISLQCADGGWNWGTPSDLNTGHIYFTWTVIQGLADLFDYVLGESENEIHVPADEATKAYLTQNDASLFKDADAAREKAARFLRERYVGTALTSTGISYADLQIKDGKGRERIVVHNPNSDLPLLYFYSYLLESLILASYDRNDPTLVNNRRAEMDRLYNEIKRRFSLVRSAGAEGTLEAEASSVQLTLFGTVGRRGDVPKAKIKDPSLWPQVLRTLVLYPYYVDTPRYVDEDITGPTGAYTLLLKDRRGGADDSGGNLWDRQAFNLSISVRALEGLIDVYDYLTLMSEKKPEPVVGTDLAQILADAILPHVRLRIGSEQKPIPPISAPSSAAPVPEVYIRNVALEISDAQTTANFAGAATLLGGRLKTIDVNRAVNQVIGKDHETFANENPVAYDIVRTTIIVCITTVSQLFAELLQEAVLSTAPAKDLGDNESVYKGPDALSNRITLGIRQVMLQELSRAQAREVWDVEGWVRQLLAIAAAPAPSGKPAKRATP